MLVLRAGQRLLLLCLYYLRCLRRTASGASGSSRGKEIKDVAQLGAQAKQSISPLKVLPTDQGLTAEEAFALDAGISLSQLRGKEIPVETQLAWTWEYGKPLVRPDHVHLLSIQMRRLHNWYWEFKKTGLTTLLAKVTEEHYIGKDQIQIYLQELFQLYQLDALDLSIISTYCL